MSKLLALNDNFLPLSQKLGEVLLLPTAIMGLIYAGTSVLDTLASEEKNSRIQVTLTAIVFGLAAGAVIAAHFIFPVL